MNQIMTVAEVAVMLNDSPAYVVKLIGDGKLRASKNPDGTHTVARKEGGGLALESKTACPQRAGRTRTCLIETGNLWQTKVTADRASVAACSGGYV